MELNRVYIIETQKICTDKSSYLYIQDSLQFRMQFFHKEPLWESVFKRHGLAQLDDTETIVSQAHCLQPQIFKQMVRLRHFYNYLHLLFEIETDQSVSTKFSKKHLKESATSETINSIVTESNLDDSKFYFDLVVCLSFYTLDIIIIILRLVTLLDHAQEVSRCSYSIYPNWLSKIVIMFNLNLKLIW